MNVLRAENQPRARSLTQMGGKLKLQGSRRETYFVPLDLNVFFLFFFHKETERENQKKKIKIGGITHRDAR